MFFKTTHEPESSKIVLVQLAKKKENDALNEQRIDAEAA